MRLERLFVAEQLIAHINERRFELCAIELFRRCAVVHEFSQVLCYAAPEIKEFGAGVEGGEDAGVGAGAGEGEVDEAELADAGVGEDFPGAVTLWRT